METPISGTEYDHDLAFARQAERAQSISYSIILDNQSLFCNKSRRLLGDHIVDVGSTQSPPSESTAKTATTTTTATTATTAMAASRGC